MPNEPALVPLGEGPRTVASVAVDVPLAHLDRPFDYESDADVAVGMRVRVRFAGRMRDGFVVAVENREPAEPLQAIETVVSHESVLSEEAIDLIRRVADYYAGTFVDVARLAVPPRHARTERASMAPLPLPTPLAGRELGSYVRGESFLRALASGGSPRALWTPTPTATSDWGRGLLEAAAATIESGRSALVCVPDAADLAALADRASELLGTGSFVTLSADEGPAPRYRAFLAARRGAARLVLGTRSALFAPLPDLGLVALHDDGDDSWAEPRAPYPHARVVAALRARDAALLLSGFHRTAEVQSWLDAGWVSEIGRAAAEHRRLGPAVRVALETERDLERAPRGGGGRMPPAVFAAIREGLARGSVLVHVPRAGHRPGLVCADCGMGARCPACGGPVGQPEAEAPPTCHWCQIAHAHWACPACRGTRWRTSRVGAGRTAEELRQAFPGVAVALAPESARDEGTLVVATPGAERPVAGGYAAAVILDAEVTLARPDLRATEEALRRWLSVASLVRPANDGGTVVIAGPADNPAVQALVRLDAVGAARRELAQRAEAGVPPSVRMVALDAADPTDARAFLPDGTTVWGPAPIGDQVQRLLASVPLEAARDLVAGAAQWRAQRSATKSAAGVRVVVDPAELG